MSIYQSTYRLTPPHPTSLLSGAYVNVTIRHWIGSNDSRTKEHLSQNPCQGSHCRLQGRLTIGSFRWCCQTIYLTGIRQLIRLAILLLLSFLVGCYFYSTLAISASHASRPPSSPHAHRNSTSGQSLLPIKSLNGPTSPLKPIIKSWGNVWEKIEEKSWKPWLLWHPRRLRLIR